MVDKWASGAPPLARGEMVMVCISGWMAGRLAGCHIKGCLKSIENKASPSEESLNSLLNKFSRNFKKKKCMIDDVPS